MTLPHTTYFAKIQLRLAHLLKAPAAYSTSVFRGIIKKKKENRWH